MGNKESGYSIGVVGATGLVGQEFIKILETRTSADLPVGELRFFASERSAGKQITVSGKPYTIEQAFPQPELFAGLDFVLTAVGDELAREYSPAIAASGAVNVDKSNAWRMDPHIPLVVPEVNPQDAKEHNGIIAGPNCSTTQLVVALWPIHQENPIRRIIVDTYQAVSGSGEKGVHELEQQEDTLSSSQQSDISFYPRQILHNVIPEIGGLRGDIFSEEQKMIDETKKIMHESDLRIDATCVRVPVYTGHSEAVHIELLFAMDAEEAIALLVKGEGIRVARNPKEYPTPSDVAGQDDVFVGRIRKDHSHPKGLSLWIVGDNLRKGAALNAFQTFELVARNGWMKR